MDSEYSYVMYSNVDGLLNKKEELFSRIDELSPSIIAITELIPKNLRDYTEKEFQIPNYDMFCNKKMSRGVALYMGNHLNARVCSDLEEFEFEEHIWCTFDSKCNGKVLIGCVYRNPNSSTTENNNKLFEMLQSEKLLKYDKICIMGDFNYPFVKWDGTWSGEKGDEILRKVHDAFLIQKVSKETRRRPGQNPTLDDWILINDDSIISDVIHQDPLGKSDHDVLVFQLNFDKSNNVDSLENKYNLKRGDYTKLRETMKDYDWTKLDNMDIQNAWSYIKDAIHKGMDKCIPKIKHKTKKKLTPIWMNKKAMRVIKRKYNLYKKYLRTKTGINYMKYIRERNKCSKILKITKREYEKNVAKNSKENPKLFWKYVKDRLKITNNIGALKKSDGTLAVSNQEKADILNAFFASVFTREDTTNLPKLEEGTYSRGITISDIRVTPKSIRDKLINLNPNKAQGPDYIPSRVLKELANELAIPLSILFNKSLESGTLPTNWKSAEVTALFKKGAKTDPGNYRPVSLTCVICKVLESLVRDAIVAHFTDNDLYVKCQHGFRKKTFLCYPIT